MEIENFKNFVFLEDLICLELQRGQVITIKKQKERYVKYIDCGCSKKHKKMRETENSRYMVPLDRRYVKQESASRYLNNCLHKKKILQNKSVVYKKVDSVLAIGGM